MPNIPFVSSKESAPKGEHKDFWKGTVFNLAGSGLMLAALALILWGFYVDDAGTSAPVYIWAILLAFAGFGCWVIPWTLSNSNWRRVLVGAFMFILLALAVDAIDGSEDWRFWTLLGVWIGAFAALLLETQLPIVKNAIEIVLVICVSIAGIALLWTFIVLVVLGNESGSMEDVLWAPVSFMVEVALPAAGMIGGIEIAGKLRRWLMLIGRPVFNRVPN